MRTISLLLILIPLTTSGQIDTTTQQIDTVSIRLEYESQVRRLKNDFNHYKETMEMKNNARDSTLAHIDSILNVSTVALKEKVKLLNEKVQVVEGKDLINLRTRFDASKSALKEMKEGITIIDFVNDILKLQNQVAKVTNIWNNETLRNFWDDAQFWGTIGGTLISGGALALNDQKERTNGSVIGIGVIGLTSVLKQLFGNETAKQYEMIDLSRKAYDDLVILNTILENYIESNKSLEKDLDNLLNKHESLSNGFVSTSINQDKIKSFISGVIEKFDLYNKTLNQIPTYISQIDGMILTYAYKYYENEKLQEILRDLSDKSKNLVTKYKTRVKPILDVSPEIKHTLMDI